LDWARQAPKDLPPDLLPAVDELATAECAVYLIPQYWSEDEAWEILGDFCQLIFEQELEGWCLDIGLWPSNRDDLPTFRKWFDVEFAGPVVDTWEHPLHLE
jgi:hypothetical protein